MPERRSIESTKQQLGMLYRMQEVLTREHIFNTTALERLASQLDTIGDALQEVRQHSAEEQKDLAKHLADREALEGVLAAVTSDSELCAFQLGYAFTVNARSSAQRLCGSVNTT